MACTSRGTQKVLYGERFRPEIQPLTLLYTIFDGKDTPFVYLLLTTGTPFTYLVYTQWRIQGRGPAPIVFLDQTEAQRAEKFFFFLGGGTAPLPVFKGLDDRTPPPPPPPGSGSGTDNVASL